MNNTKQSALNTTVLFAEKNNASNSPLGIKTSITSPQILNECKKPVDSTPEEYIDSDSGEIFPDKVTFLRRQRFELLRTARAIFAHAGELAGYKYVLDFHRTSKCSYIAHDTVHIMKSPTYEKAFYSGVVSCGNVWACPCCAVKIQERRRKEISHCMDYFSNPKLNKQAVMVTFTFSHHFGDDLSDLLNKQKRAFTLLRSGKAFSKFKEVFGYQGMIRSLEITFGANGFHPHTHELWFIDKEMNREVIEEYVKNKYRFKKFDSYRKHLLELSSEAIFKEILLSRWLECCTKAGLMEKAKIPNFLLHALDIRFNAKNSDYLAKMDDSSNWGVDRELAKSSSKKGRMSGFHPFEFLVKFKETKDPIWSARWLDYAKSFQSKNQLLWSEGLKNRVNLHDFTDEQIANMSEEEAFTYYRTDSYGRQWKRLRNQPWVGLEHVEKGASTIELTNAIASIPDKVEFIHVIPDSQVLPLPQQNLLSFAFAPYSPFYNSLITLVQEIKCQHSDIPIKLNPFFDKIFQDWV